MHGKVCVAVFTAACVIGGSSTASAQATSTVTCQIDGKPATLDACRLTLNARSKSMKAESKRAGIAGDKRAAVASVEVAPAANAPKTTSPSVEAGLYLRRSLDDFGSFSKPSDVATATGAQFSWSRDGVTRNDSWSANGLLAARLVTWEDPSYSPYFSKLVLGSYVQFDRVYNSRLAAKNIDDLTFGVSSDVAFANFLSATHYLRTRGEVVTDFEGRAKNWDVTFEYMPVGMGSLESLSPFNLFGQPRKLTGDLFYTVSPRLRAEYRGRLNGSTDPLFATTDHVFRVGPAVTLEVYGNKVFGDEVPWFWRNLSLQVTYGYLYDTVTQRSFSLLDANLTYNLNSDGTLAMSLGYRRGQLETTGAQVDLAKISLTAKFDALAQWPITQ